MKSKVALITSVDCRLDGLRSEKLEWFAAKHTNGNKSKAVRLMIDSITEQDAFNDYQANEWCLRCT